MTGRTLVALYDDPSAAWRAAEGLDDANLPSERVHVIGGAEGSSALGEGFNAQTGLGALAESRGFGVPGTDVEALMVLGAPEEDARFYAEAVRRGGTLLLVELEEEHESRVTNVIRSHEARDAAPAVRTDAVTAPAEAAAGLRDADAEFDRVRVYDAPGGRGPGA
jgi:hypothetical protein